MKKSIEKHIKDFDDVTSVKSSKSSKTNDLRKIRSAFLNIFEDVEEARNIAVGEKNKTVMIIENLDDGLLVLDKSNKIEIINPYALEFLQKTKDELLHKNVFAIKSNTIDLKPLFDTIGKNKKIKEVSREEICLGGKSFFQVSVLSIAGGGGGHLVILHDVSKDKLVDKMKSEFVSVAAHQLRTPLSAIKWTLKMMLDGDVGKLTNEQKEFLNKSYESNERMIVLVNDLLNVSRIDEGRFIYKPEALQIEDVIKDISANEETALKAKKITIKLDLPKKALPPVFIDKEKMGIVMQNLIENSIKYTPAGGKITVSAEELKDDVLIKVKDTGVGIPKDQQDRIFTKFFRGENVIRLETEGSGLGLYTIKNIVESHKGKIWFQSEGEKGTTFFFTLPKAK